MQLRDDPIIDTQIAIVLIGAARDAFNSRALEYRAELRFQDICGFDSVKAVQFILAIEQAFGILLDGEEVDRMQTLGDALSIIRLKAELAKSE